MKQITLLIFSFLITCASYGQDLVITGVIDGPLGGGTPKAVEIYAKAAIADLSMYSLGSANNGGGTDGPEFALSGSATEGQFIYIASEAVEFENFLGFVPDYTTNVVSINGDDAIELFDISGTDPVVIDTFGDINTDGTDQAWEYVDGWAYRNSGTGPDGSFAIDNWTFSGINALDGETSNGSATTPWPVGTYSATASACSLSFTTITTNCNTISAGADNVTVSVDFTGGGISGLTLNSSSGTISGDDPATVENGTIIINDVPEGTDFNLNASSDDCDITRNISTPNCEPTPEAATISELRNYSVGDEVALTGEAVLTFQIANRNQKWIEDSTAAILIDDAAGNITTTYNIGDGITGITGTLSQFNGLLQFRPSEDPGNATSTGNSIVAQMVTTSEITNNGEAYESEYIQITDATIINDSGDTNWNDNANYTLSTSDGELTLRTNFPNADYIGTTIPTGTANISGVLGQFDNTDDGVNEGYQITPRFSADIEVTSTGCPLVLGSITYECTAQTSNADSVTVTIPYSGGANGVTYTLGTTAGTIGGDNPTDTESGTIVITGVDESTTVTFTVSSDSCDISQEMTTPACEPLPEAATIAELRAYDLGTEVTLTGEAILTFQRESRNQKYIEDATAAILIDDSAGTITTMYTIGDGITGITGTLGEFRGVMQFVPSEDPGDATSTDNAIEAQVVTLAELNANGENYESEYVQVMEATIDNGGDTDWAAGTNYTMSNGGDTFTLRTNFSEADYIGTAIPTVETNVSGIVGQFNDTYQLQPRFLADFEEFMSVGENSALVVSIYPNPASNFIYVTTSTPGEKSVAIYEVSGKRVIAIKTAQPIDVSNLTSGIYLVKVTEANRSMTSKLIIQ